jgi:hypothetical protein
MHGYWFLDTIEGTLQRQWRNRDDLQSSLGSDEGQDKFLLGVLPWPPTGRVKHWLATESTTS